ncbi:MAG: hypothetical protein J6Y20_00025 [Lachnospiraceae bacterium]|nr:hypothetical protein [Lachnospiraceae bacterium]
MEQDRKLVRPPFDSDGNVVWTTEEKPMKKKALRWWLFLIPLGLICVIGLGTFLYRSSQRKTPQELCRAALRDAFEESLGYREPMMKVMHIEELADYLREVPTDVGIAIQLRNTDMTPADLGLEEMLGSIRFSDYNGMGFAFINSYDGDAYSLDVRFAVSALTLSVLQLRYDNGELQIASPKILKSVLTVPMKDVPGQWKQSAAWSLLSEADRKTAQNVVSLAFGYGTRALAIGRTFRDAIVAAYPGGASEIDRMVDAIRYEQLKDEKGKELTERLIVGSEKVPCYIFRIDTDEEMFREITGKLSGILESLAGSIAAENGKLSWRFAPQEDGGNGIDVLAYVTKEGELAQLTAEVHGFFGEKPANLSVKLKCLGADDPQDKLQLAISGDIGGETFELSAKKTITTNTRSVVSKSFDITLKMPGMDEIGLNGTASYSISTGLFEWTANVTDRGKTLGTLSLNAECNFKSGWQMDISNLTYRDRATDKHVTMYGQLKVTPSRNGVLSPEGEKVPLLTMSEEKAKEILEQGKSQVQWYINQLFN